MSHTQSKLSSNCPWTCDTAEAPGGALVVGWFSEGPDYSLMSPNTAGGKHGKLRHSEESQHGHQHRSATELCAQRLC